MNTLNIQTKQDPAPEAHQKGPVAPWLGSVQDAELREFNQNKGVALVADENGVFLERVLKSQNEDLR